VDQLALRFSRRWRWWIAAWVLPVAIVVAAWLLTLALPGATMQSLAEGASAAALQQGVTVPPGAFDEMPSPLVLVPLAAVFGGVANTLFAIGEEAGWRGYLWSVLRPFGFWRACGVTGIVWGLWHLPIIVAGHNYGTGYAGYPALGIAMMVLFTLGLSPVLGLLRDRTGSAWPPALFHGTINAVSGVLALLITGVSPLIANVSGLAGFVVLALLSAGIAASGLARRTPEPASRATTG
jgi:membrane protease YdiL (CAAX protease family)